MFMRIALLLSVLGLAACETVDGLGQDISAGGNALSNASNEVEQDLE